MYVSQYISKVLGIDIYFAWGLKEILRYTKINIWSEERSTYKGKFKLMLSIQSKSRAEYGVEKQTMRLLRDMEEFLAVAPKFLGQDIMDKEINIHTYLQRSFLSKL